MATVSIGALLTLGAAVAVPAVGAHAVGDNVADKASTLAPAMAEKVRAALHERVPRLKVLEIRATPVAGLYEVLAPDGITYTDASAEHVLAGSLLETRTERNLTQEHWTAFNRVDFDSLPLDLAIKSVRGKGSHRIAVFADPKCPYCQQLESELGKLDDLTVYTFLLPLEELHPGATDKARQIWCSVDREATWNAWMRRREEPPAAECSSDPLKEIAALGEKLHVETTPTVVFASGFRSLGAPTPKQLERLLATESPAAATEAAAPTATAPTAASPSPAGVRPST